MPDSVDSCKDVHYTIDWYAGEYLVEMDESSQNCPSYDTEVWVSRIMGHNLNIDGRDEITILRQYFDVNHSVRTGSIAVADKAVLCDGIWSGDNFQNMDFTTIFSNVDSLNHCNESLYRSALTDDEGSRIIYLGVHSTSQGHYFPGEQFTIDELNGQNKTGIFYMINGCSAFQWDRFAHVDIGADTSNYIGGLYVFDKDNVSKDIGLCAIGYSVPEGFNNLNKFTNALTAQPDMTYGEAYNYWFTENRKLNKRLHSFVAVGDLTIRSSMGTASQFTTIRIEAENFDDQNGIGTSTCEETTVITDCNWGNWVKYEAIDLGLGAEQFTAKLGMDCSCTKEFEICLNSPDSDRIGTFQVTDTDNWCNLQSQSTTLTGASGVHDLYLKFKNQGTCNMDWFEITVSTLDVSNLWVGTGKTYETDFLSSGNAQYIDRSYTFTDVTPYNGLQYIRTANNDKHETDNPFLTFLVNRDVTVYIAVDLRISMPSWLSSWHNTGEVLQGGGWPSGAAVFSKEFSAGTISLGGNESQASSISMYCVIIEGM